MHKSLFTQNLPILSDIRTIIYCTLHAHLAADIIVRTKDNIDLLLDKCVHAVNSAEVAQISHPIEDFNRAGYDNWFRANGVDSLYILSAILDIRPSYKLNDSHVLIVGIWGYGIILQFDDDLLTSICIE